MQRRRDVLHTVDQWRSLCAGAARFSLARSLKHIPPAIISRRPFYIVSLDLDTFFSFHKFLFLQFLMQMYVHLTSSVVEPGFVFEAPEPQDGHIALKTTSVAPLSTVIRICHQHKCFGFCPKQFFPQMISFLCPKGDEMKTDFVSDERSFH